MANNQLYNLPRCVLVNQPFVDARVPLEHLHESQNPAVRLRCVAQVSPDGTHICAEYRADLLSRQIGVSIAPLFKRCFHFNNSKKTTG